MLARVLRKALRSAAQPFRSSRAKSSLAQLALHQHPRLKAVAAALQDSLAHVLSPDEQALVDAIEQRRSFLLGLDSSIATIDYGAGKRGSNRAREDMIEGIRATARVADICGASASAFWATVLFELIRKLQPSSCVELGSCVGISASYQAAALRVNGKGSLQTIEGSPEIARIAQETIHSLNMTNASVVVGVFHETLRGVLESSKPIDFFFNDGHHDHDATIEYFQEALPSLSNDAVVVFDDIHWSRGMTKAWREIQDHERVFASIDLQRMGIALLGEKSGTKRSFRISL